MEIVTVPCLSDNYAYLVKAPEGVCLIDAPEAGPIIEALESRGWGLDQTEDAWHTWHRGTRRRSLRLRR